jgi:hypothetical protein
LIWLNDIRKDTLELSVLGPEGKWSIDSMKGLKSVSSEGGDLNDTILVIRNLEEDLVILDLLFNGNGFKDQFGLDSEGKSYLFSFSRYDKPINWNVKWYSFTESNHPLDNYRNFIKLNNSKPDHSEQTYDLAYTWWRSPGGNVDPDHFGTFAEASATFEPGNYLIQITSDDGVKCYVDDEMVLDHWDIHVPATDSIYIELGGDHNFRIEHFEGGGFSTLDFKIKPVKK